jgi:hypothetical protein
MSKAPPNLQELVARFGRYDLITPEAWREFDQAMADYQLARRETLAREQLATSFPEKTAQTFGVGAEPFCIRDANTQTERLVKMKRDELFPSKYLKAADLKGKAVTVTIDRVTQETLDGAAGPQQKTVVHFKGTPKMLVLNVTNFDMICKVLDLSDTDSWPGEKIALYPTTTELRGEQKDCIRVRAAAKAAPVAKPVPPPAAADDFNDDFSF